MSGLALVAVDGQVLDRTLDLAGAEALTTRGVAYREQALDGLRGLLGVLAEGAERRAWAPLGYPSLHAWAEYVAGDLAELRLTSRPEAVGVRQQLTRSLRADGATQAAIVRRLGVSAGTVRNDLRADDPAPERIVSADGSVRRSRTAVAPSAPLPAPEGPRWAQAAEWVRRAAAGLVAGREAAPLTLGELARLAGWSEGAASGALTRAMRRGLVERLPGKRGTVRGHVPVEVLA